MQLNFTANRQPKTKTSAADQDSYNNNCYSWPTMNNIGSLACMMTNIKIAILCGGRAS